MKSEAEKWALFLSSTLEIEEWQLILFTDWLADASLDELAWITARLIKNGCIAQA